MKNDPDFVIQLKSIVSKTQPNTRDEIERSITMLINAGGTSYHSIISILQNEKADLEIRSISCWVLGKIRERRAEETLIKIFKQTLEPKLLWEISKYFIVIQSKKVAPILLEILEKEKTLVRRLVAIHTLGWLRTKSAAEPLLKVFDNCEESIEIRCHAAESLGLLRYKIAINSLIEALKDKSPEVRFWSIYAIGEIGDKSAIPKLKHIASNDNTVIDSYGSIKQEAERVIEILGG